MQRMIQSAQKSSAYPLVPRLSPWKEPLCISSTYLSFLTSDTHSPSPTNSDAPVNSSSWSFPTHTVRFPLPKMCIPQWTHSSATISWLSPSFQTVTAWLLPCRGPIPLLFLYFSTDLTVLGLIFTCFFSLLSLSCELLPSYFSFFET